DGVRRILVTLRCTWMRTTADAILIHGMPVPLSEMKASRMKLCGEPADVQVLFTLTRPVFLSTLIPKLLYVGTVSSCTILKTGTKEISISPAVYPETTLFHLESAASSTHS